jgi:putative nucleotidyltransferase with HDIG domain
LPPARSIESAPGRRAATKRAPAKVQPPAEPAAEPTPEQRWQEHRFAARAVQLVVLAVPIAASIGCAAVVSAALPHAHHLGAALGWWAVVLACSTITLYAVDRVARRLLPLALLLRLSLVFPDQAPRRFRIAARAWSTRRVRDQMLRERTTDVTTAPTDAATHVISLLASLATHDRRTRGHCERVRAYNDLLAEELGLSESDRDRLRWAALIHDIGKLKVSRRLLNKPGRPTAREWEELHAHPERGAEIAAPLNDWLGPWALAISEHHEHWDGTGYPHGLAGADISLGARIVGVADAFEVMTSPRPYSKPKSAAAARQELASCAGKQFDPQVVRTLLNISLGRLRKAMGPIAWFTQVPLLASMPRLSAALIQSGQSAAAGAGGAIGVVAVATVPAAATAHVHEPVHRPPAVVQSGGGTVDPLAAVLALTGQRSVPSASPAGPANHGKSAASTRGKHSGRAAANARSHGHAAGGQLGNGNGNSHGNGGSTTNHGRQTAAGKRHHGQRHQSPSLTPTVANSPLARCGGNNGSGVGGGVVRATPTPHSTNARAGTTIRPAAHRHCN